MNAAALTELTDEIADRFEAAWKQNGPPDISSFLDGCPADQRSALIAELLRIDAAYRWKAGTPIDVERWHEQFPELAQDLELVRELTRYVARLHSGESADDCGSTDRAVGSSVVANDGEPIAVGAPQRIGRFEILDELGSGSFGVTFRAWDSRLEREVAIKVLRSGALARSDTRDRFAREARSVAQLQHDAIVPIYDVGDDNGCPYLVSKLIRGKSLATELAAHRFAMHEAAKLVAVAADALDYAHRNGIVHRDVNPRNILLDEAGSPHMIDFGLAKWAADDVTMTVEGQVLGTPAYMSPEQAIGRIEHVDQRSDVYSLGVVLYELLTGERPFRGDYRMLLQQVQTEEPHPPRRLNDAIPKDLETICLKALAKERARRYQTAGEMRDDLNCFLKREPIKARPVSALERGVRFCRRKWKVVLPSAAAVLALAMAAAIAADQAQERKRELLVEQLQGLRLRDRTMGWSKVAAETVRKAAAIGRDPDLRDYAAASLEGLDAVVVKQIPGLSASSVTFDGNGSRILLGADGEAARMLDVTKDQMTSCGLAGPGPVTFTPAGTPLQLANKGAGQFVLYDLQQKKSMREFNIGISPESDSSAAQQHTELVSALSPDGSRVAAAFRQSKDKGVVVVWDASTGNEIDRWEYVASSLAISPDGTLVAAGDAHGGIAVRSVATKTKIADLRGAQVEITCLDFHANPRGVLADAKKGIWENQWLLAAGDAGGTVTIWDVSAGMPQSFCRGAHHAVTAVAFNPDATLVAGGAHEEARLWDVATGRPVLRLIAQAPAILQRAAGLAFSSDGKLLAICSQEKFSPPVVVIVQLQNGAGIQTLRGLTTEIAKIRFSPDDRYLAAQSHRWEIGVWSAADGRLIHILQAPQGFTADNFGLAISADGSQIAASTGNEARLWDTKTGHMVASWDLPPGLQDDMTFTPTGESILLRFEAADGSPRHTGAVAIHRPQICRVRMLKPGQPFDKPTMEVDDFRDYRIKELRLAPNGDYFIGAGEQRTPDGQLRGMTRAYSLPDGRILWKQDVEGTFECRSGPLATLPGDRNTWQLFELPSGRPFGHIGRDITYVGAGQRLVTGSARLIGSDETPSGMTVYRFGEEQPIVTLGIDRPITGWRQLSLDETILAWGNSDGSVQLANLPAVQKWLAQFGLGW